MLCISSHYVTELDLILIYLSLHIHHQFFIDRQCKCIESISKQQMLEKNRSWASAVLEFALKALS